MLPYDTTYFELLSHRILVELRHGGSKWGSVLATCAVNICRVVGFLFPSTTNQQLPLSTFTFTVNKPAKLASALFVWHTNRVETCQTFCFDFLNLVDCFNLNTSKPWHPCKGCVSPTRKRWRTSSTEATYPKQS